QLRRRARDRPAGDFGTGDHGRRAPADRQGHRASGLMLGLDHSIASLGTGQAFVVIAIVAILLGLRHATDPDHLTAVTTLIAGEHAHSHGAARRLGFVWGLGHATSLFAFGVPIDRKSTRLNS